MKVTKSAFPRALRAVRKARGLAQEGFDHVSSRTYVSALERGVKVPTLKKIEDLAEVLSVHPITLLVLTYLNQPTLAEFDRVIRSVRAELEALDATEWR